jgi:predicted CoA-binding protein
MTTAQTKEPDETRLGAIVQSMKSVAVVGIKAEKAKGEPAHDIPVMLHERGIRIIPVNPTVKTVLGQASLADVGQIKERVDVLNIFRRVDAIPELTQAILAMPQSVRPPIVWFQTGIRHDESAAKLRAAGIEVVQDRCIGVYAVRYHRTKA